jgi:hypothetical protein
MDSPEFKNRYGAFTESYKEGSTVQQARTTMADLNIVLMDLGQKVLPPVTGALREFSGVLEKIRAALPKSITGDAKAADAAKWGVGTTAVQGAAIGAGVGALAAGVGALPGSLLGAAAGAGAAAVHDSIVGGAVDKKEGGRAYERPGDQYERRMERLKEGSAAPKAVFPPITMNLNIDGRTLAQAVSEDLGQLHEHATGAPAANGLSNFGRADGGITSE